MTLGEVLDVQEETPATGQTEGYRWNLLRNLGFPCRSDLNTCSAPLDACLVGGRPTLGFGVSRPLPRFRVCESIEKLHVSLFLLGIEIENQYLCLNKVIKKLKIEKKNRSLPSILILK